MRHNPVALIVPCHRVLNRDGRLGGFSAAAGVLLKKQLLDLERGPGRC
jgi:O-6-methylguanine DNA methyltransferase